MKAPNKKQSKNIMQELIKITEQDGRQAVSARAIHEFLEVGTDFTNWCKRMFEYGFEELTDYQLVYAKNGVNPQGGRPSVDYALTLDCAKEIAMLQKSEKGKQARLYFIECEKQLKAKFIMPASMPEALRLAADAMEKLNNANQTILEQAPKVLFADAIVGSKTSCLIGELAKVLNQNGVKIGQNRLFEWLRTNNYLGVRGENKNIPNQRYIEQGLFEVKKGVRSGNEGVMHTTITTKVTGKGQAYFINKFLSPKQTTPSLS